MSNDKEKELKEVIDITDIVLNEASLSDRICIWNIHP